MPKQTVYDEIDIEDFVWDDAANLFHYPCPCGDRFEITKSQLRDGDDIAQCPSCSLIVRVIYDWVSLPRIVFLSFSSSDHQRLCLLRP
jgi:diphthamide biosynthesis protein 3